MYLIKPRQGKLWKLSVTKNLQRFIFYELLTRHPLPPILEESYLYFLKKWFKNRRGGFYSNTFMPYPPSHVMDINCLIAVQFIANYYMSGNLRYPFLTSPISKQSLAPQLWANCQDILSAMFSHLVPPSCLCLCTLFQLCLDC